MAIFAVSLVLHAFLVYGLYHARLTVKVFPVRPAVRDVLLVPPVTLTLPEPIEKYIQNSPSSGGTFGLGFERDRPGRPKKRGLPEGNTANRPESGPGSGLAPGNLMKNQPGAPPSLGPSLSGDLTLGSRYTEQEDGKLRINLLAIPDHIVEAPLGFENGKEGGRSFLRYVRPNRFGTGAGTGAGASGGTSGGAGAGSGGQRARATFQSPGYDISPWAKKVIDLIQLNWKIPDVRNILEKSEVRISVTIEKNGTFSAFEIAGGMNLEVFNAAAANALRSSSPLPPLPEDFPASNLNALFVFTYHE
jgi:hypothetical protein